MRLLPTLGVKNMMLWEILRPIAALDGALVGAPLNAAWSKLVCHLLLAGGSPQA